MAQPLVLSLRAEATLTEISDGRMVLQAPGARLPLDGLAPGLLGALQSLVSGGGTEDALSDLVLEADGATGLAPLYYLLNRLADLRLLCYSLVADGSVIATLTPMAAGFRPGRTSVTADTCVRLSRFACCRREGDYLIVESPLTPVRIALAGATGAALLGALARPQTPSDLCAVPGVLEETAQAFVALLLDADLAREASDDGSLPEDANSALRQWEFHDLLFHARGRRGRHDYPFGGTFRFLGAIAALPAVKPAMSDETIPLPRPDLARLAAEDPPLSQILESRRSIREYGERPISLRELGEFLYRVAGVRQVVDPDPERGLHYQASRRPYPSGGATYDLELYLTVNACDGLGPGLCHYDPFAHQLERLRGPNARTEALLLDARWSAGLEVEPQVLITLASRFQRLSWKYQSIAYATTLKNVGVLYQTMYLVATAMGLAPCALGGGNADLFAEAAGTAYYAESSVGEFLLGSRKPEGAE